MIYDTQSFHFLKFLGFAGWRSRPILKKNGVEYSGAGKFVKSRTAERKVLEMRL
jgi:hypothetical protein